MNRPLQNQIRLHQNMTLRKSKKVWIQNVTDSYRDWLKSMLQYRLRKCCWQASAEDISYCRSKVHQTLCIDFSRSKSSHNLKNPIMPVVQCLEIPIGIEKASPTQPLALASQQGIENGEIYWWVKTKVKLTCPLFSVGALKGERRLVS